MSASDAKTHRNPPDPPAVKLKTHPYSDTIEVDVELVTPMLGGGARQREHDRDCWLRPSTVKGHLRFWWRALNAHRFDTPFELRRRERQLFGGPGAFDPRTRKPIDGPGLLRIQVHPLQATKAKVRLGQRQVDCLAAKSRATLAFRFPSRSNQDERNEIIDAIRAWVVFGGVGGKTRRAFGAIRAINDLPGIPSDDTSLVNYIERTLRITSQTKHSAKRYCLSLASLHAAYLGPSVIDGKAAAQQLRQQYREAWRSFSPSQHPAALGGINPRHASPVLLCVAGTAGESPRYRPVVLVTRPHASRHDPAFTLEQLTSHLAANPNLKRVGS